MWNHIVRIAPNVPGVRVFSKCTWEMIQKADCYLAPTSTALPVVLKKGRGVYVYGLDGKYYIDFLAGNGSILLGHSNLKLMKMAIPQLKTLALTSRELYSKVLPKYAEQMVQTFCFDKVLPCCTGNEAVEMAVKLGRKWGYKCKGIEPCMAKVVFTENNVWGTSIAAISASSDQALTEDFGPYVPEFEIIPYNDIECLCEKLKDKNVCAFVVEPIQYEGVVVPDPNYLCKVRSICSENNVLFIANEIHCGLGRAGCLICSDLYQVRPDILVVGEGLSGGISPASAVLADKDVMDLLEPGSHVSTFAASPLSCRIVSGVLKIIQDEKLAENAREMGTILRNELCQIPGIEEWIEEVRGEGLLNAVVFHEEVDCCRLCAEFLKNGLITEPPRNQVVRFTPPINIKEKEILRACHIIRKTITCIKENDEREKKIAKRKKSKKRTRKQDC